MRQTVISLVFALCAASLMGVSAADSADLKRGEKLYRKCKTCHYLDKEKNKIGPHLVGIFGRKAGSVAGFKYSDAMKASGITWDEKTIDEYLTKPKAFIPGNKMTFAGLKKAEDRADLIAYMKSGGK